MQQLNIFNKTKEELAIEFLQKHEPEEGYYVGVSFGKDSLVLYDLVLKSDVKHEAYYACTGLDAPELMRFGRKYYPNVKWLFPKRHFFKEMVDRGYPTKMARWCCDYLKKQSTKNIPLKYRLMGIRAEESWRRRKLGQISEFNKWMIYKPIFYWEEWEVWDYIDINNIKYSSLYDEGFRRLGCVVCPFICNKNQKELNRHKERWPRHYKRFEKSMLKLYNNSSKDSMVEIKNKISFETFLDNWYKGKSNDV